MSVPEEIQVSAIVKSTKDASDLQGNPEITLELEPVRAMQTQNVVLVYGVPVDMREKLRQGAAVNIILRRGTLVKRKDASAPPYDGNLPWMYRWRWGGFASVTQQPAAPRAPAAAHAAAHDEMPFADEPTYAKPPERKVVDMDAQALAKEEFTNRRCAIMQAIEYAKDAFPTGSMPTEYELTAIAEVIAAFLRGGEKQADPRAQQQE